MGKALLTAAATLALSACGIVKIEEERSPGPTGELELTALKRARPEELKGGYFFHLVRDGWDGGTYDSSPDAAVVVQGLTPGRYDVYVSGATLLKPERREVVIRPGERTTFSVLHRNVMRDERAEEAGIAILYAAAAPAYLMALCIRGAFDVGGRSLSPGDAPPFDPVGACPRNLDRNCSKLREPAARAPAPTSRTYLKH